MKKFVSIISGILLTITFSFSQTHIPSGYVNGTWTAASSPYIIDGEITLDTTDVLIIEPGVDVEFSGHYKFIIHGRLLAEGTETDSIHFTAQDTTLGWHGLRFEYIDLNSLDSSMISYCNFKYGRAYGLTNYDSLGGALYCLYSSKLCICHSTFKRNSALGQGGAIYLENSDIVISNSLISGNISINDDGGGIFARESTIDCRYTEICNNKCDFYAKRGGGICFITLSSEELKLTNVKIFQNEAFWGAGIYAGDTIVNLFLKNVEIYNNQYGGGGGIVGRLNFAYSDNVKIYDNAGVNGGGVNIIDSPNSIIQGLQIFSNEVWAGDFGGGICIHNCENLEIRNTTIYCNTHGGVFISQFSYSSVNFTNCIIRHHYGKDIIYDPLHDITVNYSNIEGGFAGVGNIDRDPLFNDPDSYDLSLMWDHFPEPDSTQSPCIDTGDPLFIDPDGTRSDMGAIPYEQTYSPTTCYCPVFQKPTVIN